MCSGVTTISPTATLSFAANPTVRTRAFAPRTPQCGRQAAGHSPQTPRMDSCDLVIYFLLEDLAPAVPQDGWTAQTPLDYTRLVAGVARQVSLAGIAGIAQESPIGPEFCDEMDSDLKETRRVTTLRSVPCAFTVETPFLQRLTAANRVRDNPDRGPRLRAGVGSGRTACYFNPCADGKLIGEC